MAYRQGQVIDHIGVRVRDYAAARPFYLALFQALDLGDQVDEGPDWFAVDELCIGPALAGGPVTTGCTCACRPATVARSPGPTRRGFRQVAATMARRACAIITRAILPPFFWTRTATISRSRPTSG